MRERPGAHASCPLRNVDLAIQSTTSYSIAGLAYQTRLRGAHGDPAIVRLVAGLVQLFHHIAELLNHAAAAAIAVLSTVRATAAGELLNH